MDQVQNQTETIQNMPAQPAVSAPQVSAQPLIPKKENVVFKKVFILIGIVILLIIIILFTIQVLIITPQKKQLQAILDHQVQNLQSLSNLNNQIIQLLKENVANEKDAQQFNNQSKIFFLDAINSSPLLAPEASSSSNVKGDQTFDPAQQLQKEIMFDKKGVQLTGVIIDTDNKIDTLYKSNPFKFLLPDPQNLAVNTNDNATKLKNLFTYEEKINIINIDQTNLSIPFTFAVTALISTSRPDSDAIIAQLKDLMAKTAANESKVTKLDTMQVPQKFLAEQNKEINAYKQQKQLMDQLFADYNSNNKVGLKKDFTEIVNHTASSDSSSFLSVWQTDDVLTSIGSLKDEWNTLDTKF